MLGIPDPFAAIEAFIAFMIALSLHDAAHALTASFLGDPIPASKGRLSLLPTRHMTAIGTIVAIVSSFRVLAGLGWGKPVEVDARRLRVGPNAGTILVALAGPLANVVLGLGVAFGLYLIPGYSQLQSTLNVCNPLPGYSTGSALQDCLTNERTAQLVQHSLQSWPVLRIEQFLIVFAVTNIGLALINIIPLYPLDAYNVVFALLPTYPAIRYRNFIPYMELTLLVIFFLIPVVLGFLGIPFDPLGLLADLARTIVQAVAGPAIAFYMVL
jgi:Zn-dependent protease